MRLALACSFVLAFSACGNDGLPGMVPGADGGMVPGADGGPVDLVLRGADAGPPDLSFEACPGDTPGIVECGYKGPLCAIAQCISCHDGGPFFQRGPIICYPDGGVPAGECYPAIACDGPEDCAPPQRCWEQEFGPGCSGQGFDRFSTTLCHSDCDCTPDSPHCKSNLCRP